MKDRGNVMKKAARIIQAFIMAAVLFMTAAADVPASTYTQLQEAERFKQFKHGKG